MVFCYCSPLLIVKTNKLTFIAPFDRPTANLSPFSENRQHIPSHPKSLYNIKKLIVIKLKLINGNFFLKFLQNQ